MQLTFDYRGRVAATESRDRENKGSVKAEKVQ
jgi:hypothetical protein